MSEEMLFRGPNGFPDFFGWTDSPGDERSSIVPAATSATRSLADCLAFGWPVVPLRFSDATLRSKLSSAYAELLNEVDAAGGIPASDFRFVQNGKARIGTEMVEDGGCLGVEFLKSFQDRRGTQVFVNVEQWHLGFQAAADTLADRIGARTGVSVFESAPAVNGFPAHYDTSHSVLFQLSGSKNWRVWPGPIELPADEHPWPEVKHLYPDGALESSPNDVSFDLRAGDCLWIPTGWVHEGLSSEEGSVHVTLGVRPSRLFEVLQHMAASAASAPALRRQVGPRSALGLKDEGELACEVVETLARCVSEVPARHLHSALKGYLDHIARRPSPGLSVAGGASRPS